MSVENAPLATGRHETGLRARIMGMPASRIREVSEAAMGVPGVIALWFGEPDTPTPKFICDAAAEAMFAGDTFYTPNRGIPDLRAALAAYNSRLYGTDITTDRITVTASGMSAMMLAKQLLVEEGDNIVCPTPQWPNVRGTIDVLGGMQKPVPLNFSENGWSLDLDQLFAAVDGHTRAIFVNSPGNPTGWMMPRDQQKALLDFARERGLWVVADEVYARVVYDQPYAPSFLEHASPEDRLIIVNSFSKPWSMTGWRLGWMVTPPELGNRLEMLNEFNVAGATTFVQRGGVAALEQGDPFIAEQVARWGANRDIIYSRLAANPKIRIARSEGAFYAFFSVEGLTDSLNFCKNLVREAKVGLAPGIAFGEQGEGWLRACFASSPERLNTALDRLEGYID